MKQYHFDQEISRYHTYSAKWDEALLRHQRRVFPLSVADMDLPTAPAIIDTIQQANNGIYGYTILGEHYQQTVANWLARHYDFQAEPTEIVHCPRVIQAISLYLQHFTATDDAVGIFMPSYSPVVNCVTLNQRTLIPCALRYNGQGYEIDEAELTACFQRIRVFILISPHNPTGIVWNAEQLGLIARLAEQYGVFVIADEVHADFVFGKKHTVLASVSDYLAQHSMICTSPAKSFNLPGLEISNIIIKNAKVRSDFEKILQRTGFHNPNYFSVPALYCAYTQCDEWLLQLKDYIAENKRIVTACFAEKLPQLVVCPTDGTYLLWINYTDLSLTPEQFKQRILTHANIELAWGEDFGEEGKGFFRLNTALPQARLRACLDRICFALTTEKE
ncbi:MalY/PatB family protein [Gallibacterium trehalosifermentans]|uniref:cysteine-S-conjugate beta-lyase n=1 Tax=Gallibacterium trehalosifermentans TaxID=516935 RepID=A0ABV6H4C4_9PAST